VEELSSKAEALHAKLGGGGADGGKAQAQLDRTTLKLQHKQGKLMGACVGGLEAGKQGAAGGAGGRGWGEGSVQPLSGHIAVHGTSFTGARGARGGALAIHASLLAAWSLHPLLHVALPIFPGSCDQQFVCCGPAMKSSTFQPSFGADCCDINQVCPSAAVKLASQLTA
jgi:hypothetical protein